MDKETLVVTRSYEVYWVTDNSGQRHLYHDRLAAQLAEERYLREAKENAKRTSVENT